MVTNAGQADPTQLFGADEPPWGAAALIDGPWLYAYACPGGGLTSPCSVARVEVASALDRAAWEFFDGSAWTSDWNRSAKVFDGAPLMSVHKSEFLGAYVAIHMGPLDQTMNLRTAPRPEGPWSAARAFGQGAPPIGGPWDYGLTAHHELAVDGGRIEYLSYFQPGVFLDGTVHLVELTFR
jgi:hypothetical protein